MPTFRRPAPSEVREYHHSFIVCMGRRAAKNAGRKGKSDAKRAKLNSKIGKLVIQAVKAGGTDPSANRQLGLLFQQAKDYGVPREIVDRNIKKASDANQADISEVTYEVYGHGGTGFIVECLTDNNNRTNSDLSAVVRKAGAKMAEPGSVMFNFQRQGHVVVQGEEVTEDGVFEAAMECGADDVIPCQGEEGGFKVVTAVDRFGAARDALKEMGLPLKLESSGLVYTPLAEVEVDDEQLEANEALVDRIMDLDDVDEVYTNCAGLTI